eukprot:GEMP01076652.1.p1 GENE.GEMP01076652.1~~GEMP01076652.1.p1  ORF type:complete len:195 (+),score=29.88 GEMP01076652.1:176-760(+)
MPSFEALVATQQWEDIQKFVEKDPCPYRDAKLSWLCTQKRQFERAIQLATRIIEGKKWYCTAFFCRALAYMALAAEAVCKEVREAYIDCASKDLEIFYGHCIPHSPMPIPAKERDALWAISNNNTRMAAMKQLQNLRGSRTVHAPRDVSNAESGKPCLPAFSRSEMPTNRSYSTSNLSITQRSWSTTSRSATQA